MHTLTALYSNDYGSGYKIQIVEEEPCENIQLWLDDIGFIMTKEEVRGFLSVIRSAQVFCKCPKCKEEGHKAIKFSTIRAEVNLKADRGVLKGLEDLVLGILFHLDYDEMLVDNNIQ
ncbi:hypothetical protein ACFSTE_12020 [Aquimarina hainanensis]|uniref:Transposase n=1 Tax=Aquimarina hainanensis TaxID=1578017 RepID=A0ABW5NAX1_9FLAO|nr:hypothetical protein [Aquimarina sp. TRL1]QKX05242.1 hypothetical protein HN014_10030 [Aquimarina sp. TRL1]